MASVDSGVETGNESNDGSLDAKSDLQMGQVSTVSLPQFFPMLPESPVKTPVRMTGCIFDTVLPPFKLPRASLPPGFGENYGYQPPRRLARRKHFVSEFEKKVISKFWDWPNSLTERKLRVAVSTNNIESVQNYLFSGANPNCVDSVGRTPLHLASCSGYADIVRLLLENGADPNQRDRLGNTPLHLAACTNNIVVVTLLLKAGTDVCSSDLHGRTPLQLAQSKLKLLCKHMGSDGVVNNYVRNQAFQIVEMMRYFLQKRGQEAEAELLSAFSTRLTLSETKEQVETQVRDLLDSLSGLSIDNSQSNQSDNGNTSNFSNFSLFSNALPAPSSAPSCSLVPSASNSGIAHTLPNSFKDSQLP